jgi:hypothetical protein
LLNNVTEGERNNILLKNKNKKPQNFGQSNKKEDKSSTKPASKSAQPAATANKKTN